MLYFFHESKKQSRLLPLRSLLVDSVSINLDLNLTLDFSGFSGFSGSFPHQNQLMPLWIVSVLSEQ